MSGNQTIGECAPGATLGHYHILEKISAGGMGEVFRAKDEHLDREVAIKVLPPGTLSDESARKRFRKEALALSKLNHPNIATIHDFDTQTSRDFLVMEYIPGATLSERLRAGPLAEKEVVQLGLQLADGLEAAHAHAIVHRDLKPGNVRITPDGRLKILDFGLAKWPTPMSNTAITASLSETPSFAGTLPYMAPEQLTGDPVDVRTDIHAAGTLLYEMATGQYPFAKADGAQLIGAILRQVPAPPSHLNPKLSAELERIIDKCLEKEPERRYQSVKELAVDLRRLGAPSANAPRVDKRKRSTANSILITGALLVAVGIALFALGVGGLRNRLLKKVAEPHIRSLAVLPLENISADSGQEYFADGMTDVLITDLARIRALRVISRTSIMRYKGDRKPLRDIARDLDVDAVVEGSILRSGTQVQITARLVEAKTDTQIWSQTYRRDLKNVLELQADVARAIVEGIRLQLTQEESARLALPSAVHPEAFDAYLRGRFFWEKRTEESLRRSLEYFQQAIAIDPAYAGAYAGLADSYAALGNNQFLAPDEAFPQAEQAAEKALSMDNNLAEAHASLAFAHWNYDFDWDLIEREYKRAIELNPGYATAYHWYAGYLSGMGRHAEAIAAVKKARELDPFSARITANVGLILYFARDYDQAIEGLRQARHMDPGGGTPDLYLGMAYLQKGNYEAAIAALERNARVPDSPPAAALDLAYAYAKAGQPAKVFPILGWVLNQSKRNYVPALWVARVYAALGETDEAVIWLRKAYDERSPQLPFLNVDPQLDPLRSDPRFEELLRIMNLHPVSGGTRNVRSSDVAETEESLANTVDS